MEAYALALTLLSARELSESQLRARLRRRKCAADDIDQSVNDLTQATARLRQNVNDRRSGRAAVDRVLAPANRQASRLFLRESRRKVWANTAALHAARLRGPAIRPRLGPGAFGRR